MGAKIVKCIRCMYVGNHMSIISLFSSSLPFQTNEQKEWRSEASDSDPDDTSAAMLVKMTVQTRAKVIDIDTRYTCLTLTRYKG